MIETVIGSFSIVGSMLLILTDKSLGKMLVLMLVIYQAAALIAALLSPDPDSCGVWSPRMLVFCAGIAVPVVVSLAVNLFKKCADSSFLLGEYSGKDFVIESARYVYSVCFMALLLASESSWGASFTVRYIVQGVFLILAIILLFLVSVRYLAMAGKDKQSLDSEPSDMEVRIYEKIIRYLEEKKPYLDAAFTMERLCRYLGTNRGYVSRSVNHCTGKNLARVVNSYRVRHAMELFKNDMSLKISDLWQMSGFGSKVTFLAAFRIENNINPREWCKELRDESARDRKLLSRNRGQGPER